MISIWLAIDPVNDDDHLGLLTCALALVRNSKYLDAVLVPYFLAIAAWLHGT